MGKNDEKGFTLTELMVVVAIIGVMTSIAIPNYLRMMPHLRLKAAVRDVESAFQLARMKAISQNRDEEVTFSLADNTFVYRHINSSEWRDVKLFYKASIIGTGAQRADKLDDKVTFRSNGTAYWPINPSEEQQAVYLTNINTPANVEEYRVVVVGISGIVKVQKFTGGAWVSG